MKKLYLVRHAKSDWGAEFLSDVDRPLNERGYRDAYELSKWFGSENEKPELIVSSMATRALSTAMIFARALSYDAAAVTVTEKIYECPAERMMSFIRELDDTHESVMVFCHNPCITDVSNMLNQEVFIDNVPTCGIISLDLKIRSWKEAGAGKASLGFYKFPKDYRNQG